MFGKIGLLVAGCGILGDTPSPLPELTAEKRQSYLQEPFRNLDSARFDAECAAALRNNDEQALAVMTMKSSSDREIFKPKQLEFLSNEMDGIPLGNERGGGALCQAALPREI